MNTDTRSSVVRPTSYARWPWVLAALTAVTGLAITLVIWGRVQKAEEEAGADLFRSEAESIQRALEREVTLFVDVLDSIRALHALSGQISIEDFEEFVQKGMVHQQKVLGAFGFTQHISHDLRERIEADFARSPEQGYRIVERDPDERLIPAARRPDYFPLTWQSHPDALGVPIGYDFGSTPEMRAAIGRLLVRGEISMALHADGERDTYDVLAPIIYSLEDGGPPGRGYLLGFAIARMDPAWMLERAQTRATARDIRVTFRPLDHIPDRSQPQPAFTYETLISITDQPWLFRCEPGPAYGAPHARRATLALWAGLLVTAWMTSQLLALAGRSRKIELEVRARTAQLQEEMKERARLEEQIYEVGTHERQKLGRDLHDSLGQKLTGAVFLSRSLYRHFEDSTTPEREHAQKLNETLKEAVGQVRAMARGLAPLTLTGDDLHTALQQMTRDLSALYGLPCSYTGDVDVTHLQAQTREQLFLIAQEAVNNAMRHAAPGQIDVALITNEDGIELVIEDDGCGLPQDHGQASGMGLRIMRHRAERIHADFAIESEPSQGTRIICRLPPSGQDSV